MEGTATDPNLIDPDPNPVATPSMTENPLFPGDQIPTEQPPAGQPILTGPPFGCPTTLSGTAFDPSGTLPLYNVVVYVPSETLAPIAGGASCDTCDGNFSGRPVAAAVTDAAGNFSIQLDEVPAAQSLPLVIQVGKWRRQITVPNVAACSANTVANGEARLPRDRSEGNLPHIALVRGASDALECLFKKIGVSDSEFTADTGGGSMHLYASTYGNSTAGTSQFSNGTAMPSRNALYENLDKLMTYDAIFLGCEGDGRGSFEDAGATTFVNIQTYADRGGRVFGSHYHNYWVRPDKFDFTLPPYPEVAEFAGSQHGFDVDVVGEVNASFPKGAAMRDWLVNVGGSVTPGQLTIQGGEHTVDAVIPNVSTAWITTDDPDGHADVVQYFSFTTPVGQSECGRMVFSDLHVATGGGGSGKEAFPTPACTTTALSAQEKALTYMLFDLSSCVQPDTAPVVPPVIIR